MLAYWQNHLWSEGRGTLGFGNNTEGDSVTFSPLISGTIPHHNKYNDRQGTKIARMIQHHHAAVSDAGVKRLSDPNQQASANYVILTDGRILGQVPEEFRAWTSGGYDIDKNAITFEVQNSSGQVNGNDDDPNSWKISQAAYNSLINLIADVAKRHRLGTVSAGNYIGHRQVAQTACPGGYLWNKMAATRAAATAILNSGKPVIKPAAATSAKPKSISQLADEVIAGKYGSGDARIRALGSKYAAVQAEVNRKLGVRTGPSISQLATDVIAGKYGSGDARVRALGANYAAVQAEVNRRLL
jgi:hypothetical protein